MQHSRHYYFMLVHGKDRKGNVIDSHECPGCAGWKTDPIDPNRYVSTEPNMLEIAESNAFEKTTGIPWDTWKKQNSCPNCNWLMVESNMHCDKCQATICRKCKKQTFYRDATGAIVMGHKPNCGVLPTIATEILNEV